MAQIRITIIRAYDSTSNGFTGTQIPDMFKPLVTPVVIETTKMADVLHLANDLCQDYEETHSGESFMPSFSILGGRKPRGFDAQSASSNPANRKWLRKENVTA